MRSATLRPISEKTFVVHRQSARTRCLQPRSWALGLLLLAPLAHAQATAVRTRVAPAKVAGTAPQLATVKVTAALDQARDELSPSTGSSLYVFDARAMKALPQGRLTPLNQVLLQAPGVVQDSFGEIHIRGNMADVQYRIDGIVIPESISGFGQTLDTRMIRSVSLLDGALPAQYGLRTAGVVNITTRSGADMPDGGETGITVGTGGRIQPFLDDHGHAGRWSWFFTGSYLRDNRGISPPTASHDPLHDRLWQSQGFGELSYLLDDRTRLMLLAGVTHQNFQIPPNPGQPPQYTLAGVADYPSLAIRENQREQTRFGVLALQGRLGRGSYQLALGQRYSQVNYLPDPVGDLIYLGVAATVARSNCADTLQADFSMPLGHADTLRYGLYGEFAHGAQNSSSAVFPADAAGNQTGTVPFTLVDNSRLIARTQSAYVQDQWDASGRLTLNGGLRYDHIGGFIDQSQLSPRLGMVYQFDDEWTLHAGYARYFTPPDSELITQTDIALFQDTSNALPGNSNTRVSSSRENDYDAGVQWVARDAALTLGLDAYYSQSRDTLDVGQFGTALIFADFNYRYGRSKGVEFSADWKRGPLSAYLNLANNLARAKVIASGQYNWSPAEVDYIASHWILLDHAPRLTSSGGVAYRFAHSWDASADYLFGSGLRTGFANTQRMPAYLQWNMALAHTFAVPELGRLHTRLAIVNVFDRAIELRNGTGIGVGIAPQYATRRELYLTLARDF